MNDKPRKEAVETANQITDQLAQWINPAFLPEATRIELAMLIDLAAIRSSADPLAGELEWYEERARQLADPKRPDSYKEAVIEELELDGGQRARAALADYRGECK